MLKKIVLVLAALAVARAQIPSLGWCPEYVPMANFDRERFLGVWHEAERYFQLTEVASRCVTSNYTRSPDGKIRVYNEVTNRFTGVKRIVEGEIKSPASKSEEGKLSVKYTSIPLAPETQYSVLGTDYDKYAVLWSCSGIGPVHTQSAWLMTRDRVPSGETLQLAYGILDFYKIAKTFFVKSDQLECSYEAVVSPTAAPVSTPATAAATSAPISQPIPVKEEPVVPASVTAEKKSIGVILSRSTAVLQDAEPADESRQENVEPEIEPLESNSAAEEPAEGLRSDPAVLLQEATEEAKPSTDVVLKPITPETIPEVILKVAEAAKEISEPIPAAAEDPISVAEESKTVEIAVPAEFVPEVVPQSVESSQEVEEKPEASGSPAELPKSDSDVAVQETLPEEKPAVVEDKPADEPLPVVEAIEEPKEESVEVKPLDEAQPVVKSPEPVAALSNAETIEPVASAAPAEEAAKAPVTSEIVKAVEVSEAAEEPAAEVPKIPEPVEQPLKNLEDTPLPEKISETILEPALEPENLDNKSIDAIPEESKL